MKAAYLNKYGVGQGAIEVILGLIIFTLMSIMLTSLSAYLYIQHSVVTAVREGARVGALNNDIGGDDVPAGVTVVQNRVIQFMQASTAQTIAPGDITVTPPDPAGASGQRTVTVAVAFNLATPLNPSAVFGGFGGGSSPVSVPIAATATLRYEE